MNTYCVTFNKIDERSFVVKAKNSSEAKYLAERLLRDFEEPETEVEGEWGCKRTEMVLD